MAKQIKSWMNEVVCRLANHGITGKTTTIKFQPVMRATGKSMAVRECPKCHAKHAVVFRGFENRDMYVLACPRCKKFSYYNAADMQAASQRGMSEGVQKLTCKGETTKGEPCRRIVAEDGNGYCAQHQGQAPYKGSGRAAKHLLY